MKKNEDFIVVTGAAKGLGLEISKQAIESGYNVIGIGRSKSKEFSSFPENQRHFIEFDLYETGKIPKLVTEIVTMTECAPFALVNNAATGMDGLLATQHASDINRILTLNLEAPITLTKYLVRKMIKQRRGRIVNISSIIAQTGFSGLSVYGATKHAVSSLTENLRIEFERYGIKVSEINPWFTETPILDAEAVTTGAKSQLDREFVNQKTKVYPVEKVVSSVWSAYDSSRIHHPVGFEAKFASFFMRHLPSLIRGLSKKLFKDSFI